MELAVKLRRAIGDENLALVLQVVLLILVYWLSLDCDFVEDLIVGFADNVLGLVKLALASVQIIEVLFSRHDSDIIAPPLFLHDLVLIEGFPARSYIVLDVQLKRLLGHIHHLREFPNHRLIALNIL